MKLILLGYMGAGKTAVGTQIAKSLQLPFFDLDSEIVKSEKRSIAEIFADSGEIYFRKQEMEVLGDFLKSGPEAFVLSVGGGTPCYGKNLDLMKNAPDTTLIYLRTSLQTLTQRLFKARERRPLISHLNTEELLKDFVRKHLFERTFYYNQSDLIIDTDEKEVEVLCEEIVSLLK